MIPFTGNAQGGQIHTGREQISGSWGGRGWEQGVTANELFSKMQ